MTESELSPPLAIGALLALGLTLPVLSTMRSAEAPRLRALIRYGGPWISTAIAALAVAGSLFYSESAGFIPCELCWYQRIAMYPLALVLAVGALRRDRGVVHYAIPLALVGFAVSAYHYQLQLFPEQASTCVASNPCHEQWVQEFGFISIPFMAGSAFAAVLALQLAGWVEQRRRQRPS